MFESQIAVQIKVHNIIQRQVRRIVDGKRNDDCGKSPCMSLSTRQSIKWEHNYSLFGQKVRSTK